VPRVMVPVVLIVALGLPAAALPARAETDRERAQKAVAAALASGVDPIEEARALVRLAWPASGTRDEAISQGARSELVAFGEHGMYPVYEAINAVPQRWTAEVLKTLLDAESSVKFGTATQFVPALIETLWVGSREAKLLALPRIIAERPALAVQPMIDSAIDDPELAAPVIDALGRLKYDQARFWLEKMMVAGPPALRPAAASSLAQIGGAALGPLKNALKSEDKGARILAARALIPAATDYDLQAIYDYLGAHADDDPELTQALKATASNIEKAIAARDAAEAAGAPKDF
jgi:HEAT repeats